MAETKQNTPMFTPEQEAQIARMLTAAVGAAKTMNPLEQKIFDEQMRREHNKDLMRAQVAKERIDNDKIAKANCSHRRYPMTAGKLGGYPVPKGLEMQVGGEWRTGGQLVGEYSDKAALLCLWCNKRWVWKPTEQERAYMMQEGGGGMAPPDHDILVED